MIVGEIVGGVTEQPRHFLSLHMEDLKPLCSFLSLVLLLTSASERDAFLCFCPYAF